MNKLPKKKPINFCKFYDNEGTTQLLLRSKFYDQYSGDDNLLQEHLMVVSVPCDIREDSFKENFFEINKFPKKEPINFCKIYDNEGTTQLHLRSDHFINQTVWYLVFVVNFITSILVIISYHKGI